MVPCVHSLDACEGGPLGLNRPMFAHVTVSLSSMTEYEYSVP